MNSQRNSSHCSSNDELAIFKSEQIEYTLNILADNGFEYLFRQQQGGGYDFHFVRGNISILLWVSDDSASGNALIEFRYRYIFFNDVNFFRGIPRRMSQEIETGTMLSVYSDELLVKNLDKIKLLENLGMFFQCSTTSLQNDVVGGIALNDNHIPRNLTMRDFRLV